MASHHRHQTAKIGLDQTPASLPTISTVSSINTANRLRVRLYRPRSCSVETDATLGLASSGHHPIARLQRSSASVDPVAPSEAPQRCWKFFGNLHRPSKAHLCQRRPPRRTPLPLAPYRPPVGDLVHHYSPTPGRQFLRDRRSWESWSHSFGESRGTLPLTQRTFFIEWNQFASLASRFSSLERGVLILGIRLHPFGSRFHPSARVLCRN